jgi:Tfp pilus assembly protein PilP
MRFVKTLVVGITLAAACSGLHAQTSPASGAGATPATHAAGKSAPQSAKPADKPAAQTPPKPAAAAASPASKKTAVQAPATQNKPAASPATKPSASGAKPAAPKMAVKTAGQAGKPATPGAKPAPKKAAKKPLPKPRKPVTAANSSAPTADREPKVAKRDPFESLIGHEQGGGPKGPLPPGKAGLQVGTLRLDGIVRAPNGMIAVVSNPQSRTYFLREGDQLYDGRVEKIAMDGVSFHEVGKDAFGKPVERQVNKRIYASAGEQQ